MFYSFILQALLKLKMCSNFFKYHNGKKKPTKKKSISPGYKNPPVVKQTF